ncbi:hypothetical protein B0H16DRAFT_1702053 [Mycena metata]|uniref:Uncharacterized protein n=1 Tax=Mycena metata TaxID=1033252 RepID=A0AAD7H7Q8_9AGAR|nr:hypothetical protein B0H16DRAFT_1702053 [Mycena metata]
MSASGSSSAAPQQRQFVFPTNADGSLSPLDFSPDSAMHGLPQSGGQQLYSWNQTVQVGSPLPWNPNSIQFANHETLVKHQNTAYINLVKKYNDLYAQHNMLIFHFIPNPMHIPIPPSPAASASSPTTPAANSLGFDPFGLLAAENFCEIRYWNRSDFSADDVTAIDDDNNEKVGKLGFLEHITGIQFSGEESRAVRKHTYTSFAGLLEDGIAPQKWSQASSTATQRVRHEIITQYPEIDREDGSPHANSNDDSSPARADDEIGDIGDVARSVLGTTPDPFQAFTTAPNRIDHPPSAPTSPEPQPERVIITKPKKITLSNPLAKPKSSSKNKSREITAAGNTQPPPAIVSSPTAPSTSGSPAAPPSASTSNTVPPTNDSIAAPPPVPPTPGPSSSSHTIVKDSAAQPKKKAKPYKPGAPDTAWNLWAREQMQTRVYRVALYEVGLYGQGQVLHIPAYSAVFSRILAYSRLLRATRTSTQQ